MLLGCGCSSSSSSRCRCGCSCECECVWVYVHVRVRARPEGVEASEEEISSLESEVVRISLDIADSEVAEMAEVGVAYSGGIQFQ